MTSRIHLISRVAAGGFSTIDHVRDLDRGVELAIKRPHSERRRAEEQLHREGEVLGHLRHEHIVALHEAGEDEQGCFLALEWIDGEPLSHVIERAPLTAAALHGVLMPVLQALAAVHAAGFAHGDLNASNLLVRRDGFIKLIDFGNAWPLDDNEVRTITDPNVGSVHHMAPELFTGLPPAVPSDLYAIGVMAWQALSGDYPFDGETPAQVITAHLRQECPRLQSSPYSDWVHRLLSRDPGLRPASALEALQLLPPSP